ncbi:JAB domain-containing protein [Citrobacter youngae]|uniref:JAB domain-containing protein n=1 Tax=Citrobacter youngae TaxID=133448 RepID=UPI00139BDD49|nr:JAB domain-containing protein [Citrobacter youngae]
MAINWLIIKLNRKSLPVKPPKLTTYAVHAIYLAHTNLLLSEFNYTRFSSTVLVKEYLRNKLAGFEHEVFAVLFLDTRHRLIEYREMFHGAIDSASVYPREVVKVALRLNAAAVILLHNHPSGNLEPSQADKMLTQRLKEALGLVEVRMLDQVIVAGAGSVSFSEQWLI